MPCSTRPATSTPIAGARPARASPDPNSSRPATNGTAGPRRSASRPASTMPITLPSMNPLNTQPYRRSPPRSCAATGITVTTASASDATKVIVRTRPVVSARCRGANSPGARSSAIARLPPARCPPPRLRGRAARTWPPGGRPDLSVTGSRRPGRAVQPGVRLVVAAVEAHELVVEPGVETGGKRVRPAAPADRDPVGDVIEGEFAEGHRREHAGAPCVRVHRVGDRLDGPAEHVGEDLAPRGGPGAAADEPDRLEPPPGEPLHRGQQPPGVQRHPFEHGPDQVLAGAGQRQVVEPAADEVVLHRGPLAVQPRGEDHSVAARGNARGHPVELPVGTGRRG